MFAVPLCPDQSRSLHVKRCCIDCVLLSLSAGSGSSILSSRASSLSWRKETIPVTRPGVATAVTEQSTCSLSDLFNVL